MKTYFSLFLLVAPIVIFAEVNETTNPAETPLSSVLISENGGYASNETNTLLPKLTKVATSSDFTPENGADTLPTQEKAEDRTDTPPIQEKEEHEEIVSFTPPSGWFAVEKEKLKPTVLAMVIGKAKNSFPPSMNLATQPYDRPLKDYLKMIKDKNAAEGYEWKDLGTIKTAAGVASLSQVDTKTQWGSVRFMHVILLKNGQIYILTAAALTEEFPLYYKDFFKSMSSLNIVNK